MIKKTLTYENFTGKMVTKDIYFHLSKADFVELALGGEWEGRMQEAIAKQDKMAIYRGFKTLISMAVCVRSEDGEDFTKPADFRDKFMNSGAYDELVMELLTSDDMGTSFIKGCLPNNMRDQRDAELKKLADAKQIETVDPFEEEPAWIRENREPTNVEMNTMTREQLLQLHKRKIDQLTARKGEVNES